MLILGLLAAIAIPAFLEKDKDRHDYETKLGKIITKSDENIGQICDDDRESSIMAKAKYLRLSDRYSDTWEKFHADQGTAAIINFNPTMPSIGDVIDRNCRPYFRALPGEPTSTDG